MNKSYKVVFSKARGALMVVNECTKSVQAKGTKTVVTAIASALMAGAAVAATDLPIPEVPADAVEGAPADGVFDDANYKYEAKQDGAFYGPAKSGVFDKNLWIKVSSTDVDGSGFWATGKDTTFENKGNIYIDGTGSNSWEQQALSADNGATAVNSGLIVANNAYGMSVGTTGEASKIVNAGTIKVFSQGAGMELGGATGSQAVNKGVIEVAKPEGENGWAHGVLIKDQGEATLTNHGTISAAEGASAIEVQTDKVATNAIINLEADSNVDGLINIKKGTADLKATLNFNGVKDALSVKADANADVEINVVGGADVELKDGQASQIDAVNIEEGRLTASIWQKDNAFKTVKVGEEGVFNVKKLNSGGDANDLENKPHDTLLLAYGMKIELIGGALQVAGSDYQGKVKIGTANTEPDLKGVGALTISDGRYAFSEVSFGSAAGNTLAVDGGELTIDNLDLTYGAVTVGGKLVVNKVTVGEQVPGTTAGSLNLEGGTLVTTLDQFYTKSEGEGSTWVATKFKEKVTNNGVINLTDEVGYTIDDLGTLQNSLGGDVFFSKGTLKTEGVDTDTIDGKTVLGETIAAAEGGVTFTEDTTIGGIDFGKETTAEIGGDGPLTLTGDKRTGYTFASDMEEVKAGTLTLGTDIEGTLQSGVVNAKTLEVGTLDVNGDYTAKTVKVTKTATVADGASFVLDTLTGGTTTVNGDLIVGEIGEKTTVNVVGMLATNQNAADILDASIVSDEDIDKPILYLDRALKLGQEAAVHVGQDAVALADGAPASVTVGTDGVLVVDANALGSTALVSGDLAINGKAYALNLNKTGTFALADGTVTDGVEFVDDNFFVTATTKTVEGKGYLDAKFDVDAVGDKELAAVMEDGMNADVKNGDVFKAVGNTDAYLDEGKTALNEIGRQVVEEYVLTPVVAGTYNVAYDAAEQVNGAIMKRNVKGEGMGVWADVFYASNEAKNIYGGQGYSADIYGGVLGFDTTFSCGAKLGAAVTVGTADADSEKSINAFQNDADFYGISLYTGKNVGDTSLYIGADMSYLWIENDLKGTVAGVSADESLDSTAFTIGLRADWTAYEGAFSVVPHAGIRYTALDVDDYRGYESDSMNVLELPIGVKVAGAFEPAAGWKLVPSVDFTITPQVGDKSVDTVLGEVDVIDNLYNTTVGVEAVNGSFSFGLTGGYGFGNDDRQNASVKANVRYAF